MNKLTPASFALCILMDLIGFISYSVPVLGEFSDIIWAPLSGLIFFRMFGGWKGAMGGIFNFIEELMPGLDFIPSFTLMWLWSYHRQPNNSSVAKM